MKIKSFGYTILTDDQVQVIHEKSLEVLERTGVWIMSEQALDILRSAGCDVKDPKRVKVPGEVVMHALEKVPHKVDVYNRDGKLAMTLEPDSIYFGPGEGCPVTIDLETGERRPSIKEDIAKFARFCDALPNIDFVKSLAAASDVPLAIRALHEYEAMLLNTTKPIVTTGRGPRDVRALIDMAAVAIGGLDEVRKHPPLVLVFVTLAPLTHSEADIAKSLVSAEYGVPFVYAEGAALGSSAPVTMAGALTQANANLLAGLAVMQVKYPGAKFIYSAGLSTFEMKYGTFPYAAPEFRISTAAMADLARFYKLPCYSWGNVTDSKILDAQAGLEYALSAYLAARSGASLIHDGGFLDSGVCSSFESILMADEVMSMVKHYLKSIEVNEKTIALDVIDEVGPGGNYLQHPHTLANFRQHLWFPRCIFRGRYGNWQDEGSKDMLARLNEAAREIFAGHPAPVLPEPVRNEIAAIVKNHIGDL